MKKPNIQQRKCSACHKLVQNRAVASLEEAEGHQHLAGGHEGGCEQMSPLLLRGSGGRDPRTFLVYF